MSRERHVERVQFGRRGANQRCCRARRGRHRLCGGLSAQSSTARECLVQCEGRPAALFLFADVYQECVVVVLRSNAMARVSLPAEHMGLVAGRCSAATSDLERPVSVCGQWAGPLRPSVMTSL